MTVAQMNLVRASEPDNPRLDRFVTVTQGPLDLLALFSAWFFLVPSRRLQAGGISPAVEITVRLVFVAVFLGHFVVCVVMAHDRAGYVRRHPFSLLAGIFPPVRFLLSLAILRWVFRRGHVGWFLAIASVIALNLTAAMYLYERGVAGTSIRSPGDALWCAMATVTTVGYGDAAPVSLGGRCMAGLIMALGICILAVVTATISSAFVDQARETAARNAAARGRSAGTDGAGLGEDPTAALAARLDRIEALLARQADQG